MSNLRNNENLKPNSRKKILFNCDICGKEVEQAYSNYLKQPGELKLCRSCRNKQTASREDVKKRISESSKKKWENEEYRKKVSESLSTALTNAWAKRENRTPVNKKSWQEILSLFERFEQMGFKLLTTEDEWNEFAGKIRCKCEYEHFHEYTLAQLKTVKKCYLCVRENVSKKRLQETKREKKARENYERLKEFFHNYEIIKVDYDGTRDSKLLFKCKEGHVFEYPNWHRKMNQNEKLEHEICPECFENNQFNWLIKEMEEEGYRDIRISKHSNGNHFIEFVCPHGHSSHMFLPNWLSGQRCGMCFTISSTSKKEQEVREFIQSLGFETIDNDRKVLNGKEIDIYIPSRNLGVEFNGLYWHSTAKTKDKYHHQKKSLLARENGVQLIQIDEDHWDNKKEVIQSILKWNLDVSEKIDSNCCEVKEIQYQEAKNFYIENSYLIPDENSQLYGLVNDSLLCAIEIQEKSILSFAFKNGIKIMGWFDKFKEQLKIDKINIDLKYWDEKSLGIGGIHSIVVSNPSSKKYAKYDVWNTGNLDCELDNDGIYSIEISEEQVNKEYASLCNKPGNYDSVQMFSSPVLYFQWKEFYKNELETWKNKEIREKLYENRLKYIGKTKEQLTNKNKLLGLKIAGLSKTFSHFSPLWLKAFIEEFGMQSIYDPCGGWGHRLLGSGNLKYVYNDINEVTCRNAMKMSEYFHLENKSFYNKDASELVLNEEVDCMFTCPPYFNTEIYSENGAENLSTKDFLIWWEKVLTNSMKFCRKYISYVVSNTYAEYFNIISEKMGLTLIKEQQLGCRLNHFQRVSENVKKGEKLFVFRVK